MHSIKSTFSHDLRSGKFWQHRSNFRIVETEEYLTNVVEYIGYNYQKMELPEHYGRPPFVVMIQTSIDRLVGCPANERLTPLSPAADRRGGGDGRDRLPDRRGVGR